MRRLKEAWSTNRDRDSGSLGKQCVAGSPAINHGRNLSTYEAHTLSNSRVIVYTQHTTFHMRIFEVSGV